MAQRDSDRPLLLVGFSRGITKALETMGRTAVVVMPAGRRVPRHDAIIGVCEVDLHGPFADIERSVCAQLDGRDVAAALAVAERTVLVAAWLRSVLGLAGNTAATALACADKVVMKRAMGVAGIPVAPWREVERETRASELVEALGLPLVIKPRRDSGGRQQQRVTSVDALTTLLAQLPSAAETPGFGWLAEGWIEGVEMSVETFVRDGQPVFSNPTEYYVPRHANILPANLEPGPWDELRTFAQRAIRAAGVERGVTHLELFRTARGLVFGELASRPPGGRLMKLLERAWGFDPWEAVCRLELGEAFSFPERARRVAGVWILHPGAGTLTGVRHLEEARAVPHVRRIALKARPGERITERVGSGQDICAVYSEAATRDDVANSLSRAVDLIDFELA